MLYSHHWDPPVLVIHHTGRPVLAGIYAKNLRILLETVPSNYNNISRDVPNSRFHERGIFCEINYLHQKSTLP